MSAAVPLLFDLNTYTAVPHGASRWLLRCECYICSEHHFLGSEVLHWWDPVLSLLLRIHLPVGFLREGFLDGSIPIEDWTRLAREECTLRSACHVVCHCRGQPSWDVFMV